MVYKAELSGPLQLLWPHLLCISLSYSAPATPDCLVPPQATYSYVMTSAYANLDRNPHDTRRTCFFSSLLSCCILSNIFPDHLLWSSTSTSLFISHPFIFPAWPYHSVTFYLCMCVSVCLPPEYKLYQHRDCLFFAAISPECTTFPGRVMDACAISTMLYSGYRWIAQNSLD